MTQWRTQQTKDLAKALLAITDEDTMLRFLRDIMTEPEIKEIAGRFSAAQALSSGLSQRKTAKKTGVSIATVTRVNQWLLRGENGYKDVIALLSDQSHHTHKED